ncbi:hypothetical protein [Tahibacter amnicola]|uniref:Uncharacterized protein n=1 Tax=Tahibacter amnicola TaxID=2976241 RepID=A0ABY6B7S3_9GAMM|nr:hypothetical protein [Tahibacter amnicola]UXI65940.1 hypothetical protein N4264_14370 [Tahibacter amnicola]
MEAFFLWDMGHETFQETLIDQLFARYGMTDETRELLACRVCADGQAIVRQVAAALDNHGFDSLDLDWFATRCIALLRRHDDSTGEADLDDDDDDYSHSEIALQEFALTYAGGDVSKYDRVWDAFIRAGSSVRAGRFNGKWSRNNRAHRTKRDTRHWDAEFVASSVEHINREGPLLPLA